MRAASEQLLLDTLKALPPNSVYSDVAKRIVFRGFQLYTNRRVTDIVWKGNSGVLLFNVLDGRHNSVSIYLEDKTAIQDCVCEGHKSGEKCEHIICALLTVMHLLKPNLFKMTVEDESYRKRLMAGLLKEPVRHNREYFAEERAIRLKQYREKPGDGLATAEKSESDASFQILIEKVGNGLRCSVQKDGEVVVPSPRGPFLPSGLEYLMRFARLEDMSSTLSIFLKGWGNSYPIFYRSAKETRMVKWRNDITCATWTEFDAAGEVVLLRKGCTIGVQRTPAEIVGDFAINKEHATICYIKERQGWKLWDTIRKTCLHEPGIAGRVTETKDWTIHIPVGIFTKFQIVLNGFSDEGAVSSVRFKLNGLEVNPRIVRATDYRLMVTREPVRKADFVIRPECMVGDLPLLPSKKITSFAKAVEWGHIPLSVRTQKRKPILLGAFFHALTLKDRKAVDDVLKKTINENTFGKRKLAYLARRTIRNAMAEITSRDMQIHFVHGNWQLYSPDRSREALLYLVPYRVFGPKLFERIVLNDTGMAVSEEELLSRLSTLHAQARDENIGLYLDGQPVEQATWDIALNATDGTIDWFEIRPEIKCNGQTIERQLWQQALAGKGVIYRNGSVHILDEKTRATLSSIMRIAQDSRTTGRDIVSMPRLRIIDLFFLRREGITIKLTPQDEEILFRLTQFNRIKARPIPSGLKAKLRTYQKKGYYWLSFLYEHGFGACLADDMGLGKTIQAITLLGAIKEGKVKRPSSPVGPFLIVVPPSLIFNWEIEIERFYPKLKVNIYRDKHRSLMTDGYDVILTSYGLIRRDIERLKELRFRVIVFDEAQTVKNIFAGATGAVRQLKGLFKIVLTGTPVENHIGEYFSIVDLILPGLLGEYREFQNRAKHDLSSLLPVVTERTKPFLLRRTKEHILKELPPKIEHDIYLELTEKQKKFYNRTVEEVRSTIDTAYRQKTASQAKIIALTAIMKLRQICLSPRLLVPDIKEISPKIEFLKDKLGELSAESHSALVFSQFTTFLDIVEDELLASNFHIFRLDGSTPVAKRKTIVEGFQGCEPPAVFLLSLKAGGQGLNLTRANYVFHLDPWWNPAVENQASDRTHRIGQKNKVIVTRLLMRHTVEEKMMSLKQKKLSLYRALMDTPEKNAGKPITREDLSFLLR